MPIISPTAISPHNKRGISWSSYWNPQREDDVNFYTKGRSGLQMTDELGNHASILLPGFNSTHAYTANINAQYSSVMEIDIGDTFEFRFVYKSGSAYLFDLYVGATEEAYAYITASATRSFNFTIKKPGQTNLVVNTPNGSLTDGVYYIAKVTWVNQTTLSCDLNGTVTTNEVAGTRTKISTANIGLNSNYAGASGAAGTNILCEILKNDTSIFVLTGEKIAFGLNSCYAIRYGANIVHSSKTYTAYGSSELLDNGFIGYTETPYVSGKNIYYPLQGGIASNLAPSSALPSNYYSFVRAGSSSYHNGADSLIVFDGASWDRSDTDIWGDDARAGYYLSGTPKAWHISELTNDNLYAWANEGYKGRHFAKIVSGVLQAIFSFDNSKTGDLYDKIKGWCSQSAFVYDGGGVHTVSYEFDDDNIVATRGDKMLVFDVATTSLKLSSDGGSTFPVTKDVGLSIITHAHIFLNGNILFCDHTKAYLSTDNLSTFAETTVLDIAGDPFTAGTLNNFRCLQYDYATLPGGGEILVWGAYPTGGTAERVNVNVWYSVDNGVTVKSAWKANVTSPAFDCRHIHAVNFNSDEGEWIMSVGDAGSYDGAGHFKGTYNEATDAWTWTSLSFAAMNTGSGIYGGILYWGADSSAFGGVLSCPYDRFLVAGDHKYLRLYSSPSSIQAIGLHVSSDGEVICVGQGSKWIITSINGRDFKIETLSGGGTLNSTYPYLLKVLPKNNNGEYVIQQVLSDETIDNWTLGQVVRVKLVQS